MVAAVSALMLEIMNREYIAFLGFSRLALNRRPTDCNELQQQIGLESFALESFCKVWAMH